MQTKRVILWISVTLALAWAAAVLLSWLLSAMMVPSVRSLLTGEGIRWFFAHFTDSLCSPLLAWLLLAGIAYGCVSASGMLCGALRRQRGRAVRAGLLLLLPYMAVIALLTLLPHAVLLSGTGTLCGSPFSRALVPVLCFGVVLFSVAYGLATRSMAALSDVTDAMVDGLRAAAPLLFLYVLAAQLWHTLRYVFL